MEVIPSEKRRRLSAKHMRKIRGYVTVLLPEHHRAHLDGYVFEHIVVAEAKVGRPIRRHEVVHHINGVKHDNRPENLEVLPSHAHHSRIHQGNAYNKPFNWREIETHCLCGCGHAIRAYDSKGRPRSWVHGHQVHARKWRPTK